MLGYSQTITILAAGDVLLHKKLQTFGIEKGFATLWQKFIPNIQSADIAYANLEGPVAENLLPTSIEAKPDTDIDKIYTSFPMFNYPPQLVDALKQTGFDIVSTANNHALDRSSRGIDKTLDKLKQSDLSFIGTRQNNSTMPFFKIISAKGISMLWIACTQDTNGIEDTNKQVLYCFKKGDSEFIEQTIRDYKNKVDIIIITPHWGEQYELMPSKTQQQYAKRWLDEGASLVIGNHPHVLQPIRYYQTQDGRQTLIAYSLGNFVSNQGSLNNRLSGLLELKFEKDNNITQLKGASFMPTIMSNRGSKLSLEKIDNKTYLSLIEKQIDKNIKIITHN